jgi:hypothetical protein
MSQMSFLSTGENRLKESSRISWHWKRILELQLFLERAKLSR